MKKMNGKGPGRRSMRRLILFSAAFFQLVTKRIFRHLEMLTEAVKNAPAGDFRVTLSPDILQAEDEVGILAKQFQHLMNQIDDLIHRELEGRTKTAGSSSCPGIRNLNMCATPSGRGWWIIC